MEATLKRRLARAGGWKLAKRLIKPIPFVGTVPAIKPACAQSKTKRISVLATSGTVKRDYTRDLIREHLSYMQVEKGLSVNSLESYRRDLAKLRAWAERRGLPCR